jgi:hypothetical protein
MKKLLIVFILSTLSLFAISSNDPTSNSNSITLKGKVLDMKTNEVLAGVQVSILNTDYKTYTDLDGNFYFKNLPNEKYEIVFSLISYNNSLCETDSNKKDVDVKMISQ